MAFSIYVNGSEVELASPTEWQSEIETMTADHQVLNGEVRRQRRIGAPTRVYRVAIRWDELTKAEADAVENVWAHLIYDPTISETLIAPDSSVYLASIETGSRAFSREPFATGDGVDAFMVTLVLRLEA